MVDITPEYEDLNNPDYEDLLSCTAGKVRYYGITSDSTTRLAVDTELLVNLTYN